MKITSSNPLLWIKISLNQTYFGLAIKRVGGRGIGDMNIQHIDFLFFLCREKRAVFISHVLLYTMGRQVH